MTDQFLRSFQLDLGDFTIKSTSGSVALRVAFAVERDAKPYPNQCEIAIWNLNRTHREALTAAAALPCRLAVGYRDNIQQIFLGNVRRGLTVREGPDLITRVSAGDSTAPFKAATIARTFAEGTPIATVLEALAAAVGVGLGNVPALLPMAKTSAGMTLTAPLTVAGGAAEELTAFLRSLGMSWSIQDGAIQVLDIADPYLPIDGPAISPSTGLVSAARVETDAKTGKAIVTGKALLLPELIPGKRFRVESSAVNGAFACRKTRHFGDNMGPDWYVDFEGEAI